MGERVRIDHGPTGELLAIKTAPPGAEHHLAVEASVLRRAQVPGVVELVEAVPAVEPGEGPQVLVTRWVGPRTLADLATPLEPVRAAGLCLSIAGTLGRLHRCGVVHGRVEPSHVVLDAHGRPVLCGFGGAEVVQRGSTLRPADDVTGLARLLALLLGAEGDGGGSRRGAARAARSQRRALLGLAAAATVDDPACRPSLPAFVHGLRRAVPAARLTGDDPSTSRPSRARTTASSRSPRSDHIQRADQPDRPRARRDDRARPAHAAPNRPRRAAGALRSALGIAGVLAVGATTWFGLTAWRGGTGTPPTEASSRPTSPLTTTAPTSTTGAPPSSTTTTRPPSVPPSTAPVVEHDGRRFEVGEPGDVAVVGPWFCDGVDQVALLRPSTGTVHVFSSWAPEAGTVEARTVATVPGASELTTVADGPDCAVLAVGSPTGTLRTLTVEDLQ